MPKKIPKSKARLEVLIDKKIYEQLIRVAPLVYGGGKYRGAISFVVEEALKHYLAPRLHTQTHTNPPGKVRIVYGQVIEAIKRIMNYDFKPTEIPERILDMAIGEVRGSDPRTISKWKRIFYRFGLIKYLGGTYPNRIVELI